MCRNKHTTASCSFSNCRCKSAAVKGLGCLNGPGPIPTPVLSPAGIVPVADVNILLIGDIKGGVAVTALWFEGRILREVVDMGGFGEDIAWEVRREEVRDVRRGEAIISWGLGDGGTEFRSGAMTLKGSGLWFMEIHAMLENTRLCIGRFQWCGTISDIRESVNSLI